jgi:hypothetical protein
VAIREWRTGVESEASVDQRRVAGELMTTVWSSPATNEISEVNAYF